MGFCVSVLKESRADSETLRDQNLDSSDHTSHTAFLSELDNGACPDTHPVGLMKLLYEVTWDVNVFADRYVSLNL